MAGPWKEVRGWAERRGALLGALGYLLLILLVPFFDLGLEQIVRWTRG